MQIWGFKKNSQRKKCDAETGRVDKCERGEQELECKGKKWLHHDKTSCHSLHQKLIIKGVIECSRNKEKFNMAKGLGGHLLRNKVRSGKGESGHSDTCKPGLDSILKARGTHQKLKKGSAKASLAS